MWYVPWRTYDARCLLIGLEVLFDRRIVASVLFVRDILVGRIDCADLALLLRFKEVFNSRRGNAGLLTFFYRNNYGRFEQVNNHRTNTSNNTIWKKVGASSQSQNIGGLFRQSTELGTSHFRSERNNSKKKLSLLKCLANINWGANQEKLLLSIK
jgi:hypothetical protein